MLAAAAARSRPSYVEICSVDASFTTCRLVTTVWSSSANPDPVDRAPQPMFRMRTAMRCAESNPSGERLPLDVGVGRGRSVGTTLVGTGAGIAGSTLQPAVSSSGGAQQRGPPPHRWSSRCSAALASVAFWHTVCTSAVNRARSAWSYWAEFCR